MSERVKDTVVHPKLKELPGLTSLRFVAAILVVLYHYIGNSSAGTPTLINALLSLGYTGVTFFFVLSGFILAYNYESVNFEVRGSVIKFLAARVARIYPLYLVSLLIGLGPFSFAVAKSQIGPIMHRLYLAALVLAPLSLQSWIPGAASAINFPSWSISTEFFFYCCFPFILPRVIGSPRLWLALTLGYWVAINVITYTLWGAWGHEGVTVVTLTPSEPTSTTLLAEFIKFFPLFRLPEFIAGILTYVYWTRYRDRLRAVPLVVLSTVCLSALVCLGTWLPATLVHNGLSAVVWLPLILAGTEATSPVLTSSLSVLLGRLSFALYLFHIPCLQYVKAVAKRSPAGSFTPDSVVIIALVLSFVCAAVGHVWIEEPMRRRLGKIFSRYYRQ